MTFAVVLLSAALAVSVFTAAALVAAPRRREKGRIYLALAYLQAAILFLKDLSESAGGPPELVTFLIYANFLFGIPALYLFLRASCGDRARLPMLHFIPALVNLPFAVLVSRGAFGSAGIDGPITPGAGLPVVLPIVYINLVAAMETLQLILYARASFAFLRRRGDGEREKSSRLVVMGAVACYAVYYAIRWIGFLQRVFISRGGGMAPRPFWVNYVSVIIVAVSIGLLGVYILARPEFIHGRRGAGGPKYGGKPMDRKEEESLCRRAEDFLASCPDLSEVDPRRLAKRLDVPYYVLSRAVNEHRSRTIADVIRIQRVERAKALMDRSPGATILSIALDSGFRAKSSFNEAFKKTMGMSPTEYRERHGADRGQ